MSKESHIQPLGQCPHCLEPIQQGARKCRECGSFIGWRHAVNWALPAVASILAVGLGLPTLTSTYRAVFWEDRSDLRQLTAGWDGAVLRASYLNLGSAPAVFQGPLRCQGTRTAGQSIGLRASRVDPGNLNRASQTAVVAFPNATVPTELQFALWTTDLKFPADVQSDSVEAGKTEFLRFLEGIPELDPDTIDRWYESKTEAITFGPFLNFKDPFDAFAELSMKAVFADGVEPQAVYEFECTVTAEDAAGNTPVPSIKFEFAPGNHSLTYNGITIEG